VVVVVEDDVHEAHLMTASDARLQGADLDLEVAQDMVDVPGIVQNMDLGLDLALTLLPSLMEMDGHCLVQGLGLGPGLGLQIEIESEE